MKKKLTEKDKSHYIDIGYAHCPFCKSDDIVGDSVEIDGKVVWQDVECSACGAEWQDVYSLTEIDVKHGPTK